MGWNWQQEDWPNFTWHEGRLGLAEREFLLGGGVMVGTVNHLGDHEQTHLTIESLCTEALTTSEIEGEMLDRASVQSSIRRQLGLATDNRRVRPQEQGIAEMMVDMFRTPAIALSEGVLCAWHRMVMSGAHASLDVGKYRAGESAMPVVSGNLADPKVHFEAPPSTRVSGEMKRFIAWFNRTGPVGPQPLPALAEFLVDKVRLFARLDGQLNERQMKALLRVFEEGPEGFKGGLSAGNYTAITKTSPATATRDLTDLVEKGALVRTGEHRHARYRLAIPSRPVKRVSIGERGELLEEQVSS
jgi:Fic family protein